MTRGQKLTLCAVVLAALAVFLCLILTLSGCAADFTDDVRLYRPQPGPVAQARRNALAKALADDQTKRVKREAIMTHAHKHATNSIFVPIPLARPGDASISIEDADPKQAVITPANKHATNGVALPVGHR